MYGTDHDDLAPLRDSWMDATEPYHMDATVEHCPDVKGDGLFGYAFNAGVKSLNNAGSTDAATPLVYDSVNLAKNASDLATSMPQPGRHQGRDNVAYVDGHAKSVEAGRP